MEAKDLKHSEFSDVLEKHYSGRASDFSKRFLKWFLENIFRLDEFAADDATDYHNPALKKDAELYLVCGAGGQAALAGKTLKDMGFQNVTNVGGFPDWKAAGGPSED